jgi:membrane fusion protein (multidrug efflux system)
MRLAMQPYLALDGSLMTSGIAIHGGNAEQLVEVDTKLSRSLDRPVSSRHAAVPKMPLRQRLRRLLLIAFPVILVAVGTAYYLAEEPYTSRRMMRSSAQPRNRSTPGLPAR